MDQDQDGTNGESPEDQFTFIAEILQDPLTITAGTLDAAAGKLTVTFSDPVDPATFTTADLALTRPDVDGDGEPDPIGMSKATITADASKTTFTVTFTAQSATGEYTATIGPDITSAAGAGLENAVRIANRAAGIVVGKLGTATASRAELFGKEA